MKAKGWILWVCLAINFVSVPWLFFARIQAGNASAEAADLRQQLTQAQAKLDAADASTAGEDNAKLRADNQSYSQKLAKANSKIAELMAATNKLAGQLQTARLALGMQQDHLKELTVANQAAEAAANAPRPPTLSPEDAQLLCMKNLHLIINAKQAWALDNAKGENDAPTVQDLLPYFRGGAMPTCPAGGSYTIGAMNEAPACTIPGHALPQQ